MLTKPTGVITIGTLACAIVLRRDLALLRRARYLVTLLAPAMVLVVLEMQWSGNRPPWYSFVTHAYITYGHIVRVPDLFVGMLMAVMVIALGSRFGFRSLRSPFEQAGGAHSDAEVGAYRLSLCGLLIVVFIGFYTVAPMLGEAYVIPRYYLQIMPALAILLCASALRFLGRRITAGAIVAAIVLFCVNNRGILYPRLENEFTNAFYLAERSNEYEDLLALQKQVMAKIEQTPEIPIFYGFTEHYYTSYPIFGYVSKRPANGYVAMLVKPYSEGRIWLYPKHFIVIKHFQGSTMGGQMIESIFMQAQRSAKHETVLTPLVNGQFHIEWLEVREKETSKNP